PGWRLCENSGCRSKGIDTGMTPQNLADAATSQERIASEPRAERANLYVPRILQQHIADDPNSRSWTVDGAAAFIDISGFPNLSESLAPKGREGAEQITEAIGRVFESMLAVAYDNGGSLIKFGGDSLLLWFEGEDNAARAGRSMVLMREALGEVGNVQVPGAQVALRMSQG